MTGSLPVPLPLGCVFQPTDDELVSYYLSRKVAGHSEEFYTGIVHDFDVFGQHEPWQIWQIFGASIFKNSVLGHEDLYFFTKLKKTTPKGKRASRKVGSGTWKGQDSGKEVHSHSDDNLVTGLKKRFQYQNSNGGCKEDGDSWIMFEYSLPSTTQTSDYVLCQIHKKYSSPSDHQTAKKKRKFCTDDHLGFDHVERQYQSHYQQQSPSSPTILVTESSSTLMANPHNQQNIIHGLPDYINMEEEEELLGCDQQQYQPLVNDHNGGLGHNNTFVGHQPLPSPPTISVDDYEQENIILCVPDDIHHVEEELKQQQQHCEWMFHLDYDDDGEKDHNQPPLQSISLLDMAENV